MIIPGNPGTAQLGLNVDLDIGEHEKIVDFCLANEIEFIVIGPEQPLVDGLTDKCLEKGIKVFGPSKQAA
ncbi:MAG: phosphoribosylamine--glycine ligase, partial [Melioribacteraceae bacterium]|nr:phosphoribosylamine--glycine ligase [Melioribacteraceae bacterium]